MANQAIDDIDLRILNALLHNALLSNKEMGETVAALNKLLEDVLKYGNYKLSISIEKVK
ncbi:AsnC family transcriptional regulator [Cohnella rhizosphaerae]|uniref:HTH asnC-type domain-containing protein n=1 Tax=Cohnella rhizosphaerae TaxID=1457232 RepID=A0A9X4KUU5_9BACL|nr:AsnC family transcriptional regulator [Cohnella rhizosphaerae]MDG0811322.1 hypothetical protein [Cohnella rhizosphaerae]